MSSMLACSTSSRTATAVTQRNSVPINKQTKDLVKEFFMSVCAYMLSSLTLVRVYWFWTTESGRGPRSEP